MGLTKQELRKVIIVLAFYFVALGYVGSMDYEDELMTSGEHHAEP